MIASLLAACIGLALPALFSSLPPLIPLAVTALLSLLLARRWRCCRWLSALLLGLCWACWYGEGLTRQLLPVAWQGETLLVDGVVSGLPASYEQSASAPLQRFDMQVYQLCLGDVCTDRVSKLRISWYRQAQAMIPGQRWQLAVRLKWPWGTANPGGFDYQQWLVQQGVGGVGYVVAHPANQYLEQSLWSIDYWRWRLVDYLTPAFSELRYQAFLLALLLGDKRAITPQQWQLLADTGVVHLLVISGLHVGLMAALGFHLGRLSSIVLRFGLAQHQSGQGWSPEQSGALLGLLLALIYAAMAGFSLPTQRALVMVTVWMLAIALRRSVATSAALLMALLLCLALDPLAVLGLSFWLSFGAVGFILLATVGRRQTATRGYRTQRGLVAQLAVFIGLMPVLAVGLGKISWVAPLANLLLIPLFTLLIVPVNFLALAVSLLHSGIALGLWRLLDYVLDWVFRGLLWLDQTPVSVLMVPALPVPLVLLCTLAVVVILLPKAWPGKLLAWVVLVSLPMYRPPALAPGDLDMAVLDVGQGLAVVISTRQHVLVYDVGAGSASFSMAQQVVLPYLAHRGVAAIDLLLLSHNDNDHAGGSPVLAAAVPITQWLVGEMAPDYPPTARRCEAGQVWYWDEIKFEVLYPDVGDTPLKSNNRSCVLKVSSRNFTLLLPGDIEAAVERQLLARGEIAAVDVLVAPHHGSSSSSSPSWVETTSPRHVIYTSGYRNRYGHPRASVRQRYQAVGASEYCSCEDGAIMIRLRDARLSIERYRNTHYEFWRPKRQASAL